MPICHLCQLVETSDVDADAVEFAHRLGQVARADAGLKQVGARADVAIQKLQLARRWTHRAATIASLSEFGDDPDFAFASMYRPFRMRLTPCSARMAGARAAIARTSE